MLQVVNPTFQAVHSGVELVDIGKRYSVRCGHHCRSLIVMAWPTSTLRRS